MSRALHLSVGSALCAFALTMPSCGARTDLGFEEAEAEPRPTRCGDGLVEAAEGCDDGNDADDDACTSRCERARCGDGLVRVGFEGCDEGGATESCTGACVLATCGDGTLQGGEECDDGNLDERDGCSTACLAPRCGNDIVEGDEECDGGSSNDDRPAAFVVQNGVSQSVTPFITGNSAVDFYDLRSASAHTGFEALDEGNVFLHIGTAGELSLVIIHGIDRDDGGPAQGDGRVIQTFGGLPPGAFVALSDDTSDEFDFAGASTILGDWVFHDNTDGGIIGGLPWPGDYTIEIGTTLELGVTSWGVLDATRDRRVLDEGEALLVVQTASSACRTDCTIPRCNDGILDGGEACDDGNPDAGDGCAPDCLGP